MNLHLKLIFVFLISAVDFFPVGPVAERFFQPVFENRFQPDIAGFQDPVESAVVAGREFERDRRCPAAELHCGIEVDTDTRLDFRIFIERITQSGQCPVAAFCQLFADRDIGRARINLRLAGG